MMLDADLLAPARARPLRRAEYDRLVELGAFEGERVQLLRGMLVEMTPQGSRHAAVIQRLNRLFVLGLAGRAEVRVQLPLAASDDSEPEPDLAVVPPGDYLDAHPSAALLVVEVAESSGRLDRELKAELYAASGVPEYWLLDLRQGVVEVFSSPTPRGYSRTEQRRRGETLFPAAFPDLVLHVSELLP